MTLFFTIYVAAQGADRVQDDDDKIVMSSSSRCVWGVIQGDVMSPVLLILVLNQLIQNVNTDNQSVISTGKFFACERFFFACGKWSVTCGSHVKAEIRLKRVPVRRRMRMSIFTLCISHAVYM